MIRSPLLIIHIGSALVALLSGWTAMLLRKGSRRHGAAGNVFFFSMFSMCASAVTLAVMKQQTGNVVAGILTFYLVGTAWLTAKRKEGATGSLELWAMLVAFAVGVATWTLAWQVSHGATPPKDGVPATVYFVFGSIALLSAAGDVRMLMRGGVFGGRRLARHLWRMCTALLIATLSALAGKRAEILPEAIRKAHILNVPILMLPIFAILVVMIFWLFRVRLAKRYKKNAIPPRIKTASVNILA
jgi:uncharacterized membrane protein